MNPNHQTVIAAPPVAIRAEDTASAVLRTVAQLADKVAKNLNERLPEPAEGMPPARQQMGVDINSFAN